MVTKIKNGEMAHAYLKKKKYKSAEKLQKLYYILPNRHRKAKSDKSS